MSTQSKAADLRITMNLLFSEHAYLLAKAGDAAAGSRTDEYTAYATQLTRNSDDLQGIWRNAVGSASSAAFGNVWNQYLGFVAQYTVGDAAHDDSKKQAASTALANQFVPALSALMQQQAAPDSSMTSQVTAMVTSETAVLDDEAASNWSALFTDIEAAARNAGAVGDLFAFRIVRAYPDRFPGSVYTTAVNLRLSLNLDLQQLAYLGTMTTAAVIGGRSDEAAAGTAGMTATAQALIKDVPGSTPDTWAAWTTDFSTYATKSDLGDLKQASDQVTNDSGLLSGMFHGSDRNLSGNVFVQTRAETAVVDAQRLKDPTTAAQRDRSSAAAMAPVADLVTSLVVNANPAVYRN